MGTIAGGRPYDARKVNAVIGGSPITGFADGDFITFTPSADISAALVGSTGDVGVAVLADRTASISFNILQGSRAVRQQMERFETEWRELGISQPILIRDTSTGETITIAQAWPMTPPASPFGAEHGAREYVWMCADYVRSTI